MDDRDPFGSSAAAAAVIKADVGAKGGRPRPVHRAPPHATMLPVAVSALLCIGLAAASNVNITTLSVPKSVKLGSDVELQCKYILLKEMDMFYVKWWYNPFGAPDNHAIIYQRIGGSRPHPPQSLRKNLKILANDTVMLVNVTLADSGTYECEVFNVYEARQSANLVVYSGGEGPMMTWTSVNDGPDDKDVVVSCNATDVTPEPELNITVDGQEVTVEEPLISELPDGFYSISVNATIEEINQGAIIRCELFFKNRDVPHEPYVVADTYNGSGAEETTTEALEVSTLWGNSTMVVPVPDGGHSILVTSTWLALAAFAAVAHLLASH